MTKSLRIAGTSLEPTVPTIDSDMLWGLTNHQGTVKSRLDWIIRSQVSHYCTIIHKPIYVYYSMNKLDLDLEVIRTLYVDQLLSAKEISVKLGCSEYPIAQRLRKMGITRTLKEAKRRKSTLNHSFFKSIDTQDKAYWLGFMYADGNVFIRHHHHENGSTYVQHTVSASQKDGEHLLKFKKTVGGGSFTKYDVDGEFYHKLTITSEQMVKNLISHGCIPCKSLVKTFPTSVPAQLHSHFIRGYFDGNGSVYLRHHYKDVYSPVINITSTEMFLAVILRLLPFTHKIKMEKRHNHRNNTIRYIRFNGYKRVNSFYNMLYADANTFLEWKRTKFESCLEKRVQRLQQDHPYVGNMGMMV